MEAEIAEGIIKKCKCTYCNSSETQFVTKAANGDDLYLCSSCGIAGKTILSPFTVRGTTWEQGNETISQIYMRGESWRRKVALQRLNLLDAIAYPKGNLLDIGCATGLFVNEAMKKGWNACGIDTNEEFISYGSQILHLEKIIHSKGDNIPYNDNSFSLLTSFDTLGYSVDLKRSFSELRRVLIKGGLFFTVNIFPDNLLNVDSKNLSFNYYFGSNVLKRALAEYGLENIHEWHEAKNLNTLPQFSPEWWRSFLNLDKEVQMAYEIYKKIE
jgi:ubiquinone/menaquinone biosynthesis C-methylase UbiE